MVLPVSMILKKPLRSRSALMMALTCCGARFSSAKPAMAMGICVAPTP